MAVIVVSGLPRSGTSMMMSMLAQGGVELLVDGVRTADDDNPRGYFEFEPVKQTKKDASWLESADEKAVKIIYTLLYDLPSDVEYRVVFMRRPMDEILASQAAMLARSGQKGAAVSADQLGTIFERALTKATQWIDEQPNMRSIEIWYKDAIDTPGAVAERVSEFLERPLDTAAMSTVVDASLYRQRA